MPPKSFPDMSLDQQRLQLKSTQLWAVTKAMGDRESEAVLLTTEHGPTGTEVSGLRMTTEMEQSLALYFGRISGTLGEGDCSILASKCPGVSWDTFAEVLSEVSTFLGTCTRKVEIALMADVVTQHRWPKAQDVLRIAFEKDPSNFRRLLNQTTNPVSAGRIMMGWLWFWQAVDAAWARRKGLKVPWLWAPADASGLPTDNPVSDSKLSTAIKAWRPAMLPHPRVPERRADAPQNAAAPPADHRQATLRPFEPAAGPVVDDTAQLASELQAAWDVCQDIPPEHVTAAATNLQLRMAPIPSMAASLRTIGQATSGRELGTILTSQAGYFGADSGAAATAVTQWRDYLVDKRLLQATPTSKQELLEAVEEIFAAHTVDWDWKALEAHVAVAGAQHQLPGAFMDSLMATTSLETFWPAYVQFVVHVPDIQVIRECNDHLRSQAGVQPVPNWAARYYDRVPGARHGDKRGDRRDSWTSEQHDDRPRGRSPERARGRKRTSPSPKERMAKLQIEGITGLPRAEVAAAVSAVLGQPLHVPAWATKEGSCKITVPKQPGARQRAAPNPSRHLRPPGRTSCFAARQSVTHVAMTTSTATVAGPPPWAATPRPTTSLRRCAVVLQLVPAADELPAPVTVGGTPRRARRTIRIGTRGTALHRGAGRCHAGCRRRRRTPGPSTGDAGAAICPHFPTTRSARRSAERSAHATEGTHIRHSDAGQRAQERKARPPVARRGRRGLTGRRPGQRGWRRRPAESPSPNDSRCTCWHRTWCRRCPR